MPFSLLQPLVWLVLFSQTFSGLSVGIEPIHHSVDHRIPDLPPFRVTP